MSITIRQTAHYPGADAALSALQGQDIYVDMSDECLTIWPETGEPIRFAVDLSLVTA